MYSLHLHQGFSKDKNLEWTQNRDFLLNLCREVNCSGSRKLMGSSIYASDSGEVLEASMEVGDRELESRRSWEVWFVFWGKVNDVAVCVVDGFINCCWHSEYICCVSRSQRIDREG